jgi:hypothetical protein
MQVGGFALLLIMHRNRAEWAMYEGDVKRLKLNINTHTPQTRVMGEAYFLRTRQGEFMPRGNALLLAAGPGRVERVCQN